jgi:hypothetical protein
MSKEQDRPPLSTEIPPLESELDLHPSGCWTGGLEVPRLHKCADAAAGDGLAIDQMLSGRYRIERELGEGGMGVVYLVSDQLAVSAVSGDAMSRRLRRPERPISRENYAVGPKMVGPSMSEITVKAKLLR